MKLHPSFFATIAAIFAAGLASAQTPSHAHPLADSPSFKLSGIPLERLAKMDGTRVQVAGHIDATTVVDTDRGSNRRPADDLGAATFIATSIDAIDGTCPKR
jgi:hypothetical protein